MTDRSVVVHDYKYEPSDYSDDRSSAAHGEAYRDDDDDYSDDYVGLQSLVVIQNTLYLLVLPTLRRVGSL